MKHEFKVACQTCGKLFLSHTFRPSKWWYFTAARHFLENANHGILWVERFDNELDIVFLSERWRRHGIPNLLQEIRDLKERFRIADTCVYTKSSAAAEREPTRPKKGTH